MARTRGSPPKNLTGRMPVSPQDSPWWAQVIAWITGPDGLVGRTLTIEALAELIPSYPDGRRPRPRAVARRLRSVLRLVGRGPNGSLGRGATYDVVLPPLPIPGGNADIEDDVIGADEDYIAAAVERMTREK